MYTKVHAGDCRQSHSIRQPDEVEKFVSDLIVGLANALSQQALSQLFTIDTLHLLASESLTVLAADPQFLTGHNQFATQLLAALLKPARRPLPMA